MVTIGIIHDIDKINVSLHSYMLKHHYSYCTYVCNIQLEGYGQVTNTVKYTQLLYLLQNPTPRDTFYYTVQHEYKMPN